MLLMMFSLYLHSTGGLGWLTMDTGPPSRTAMAVARARADHQSADEPRIFTDPYARAIAGESDLTNGDFDRGLDPGLVRRRRMFIAARSQFADDTVAAAAADGTRQVVILGAGLDTRERAARVAASGEPWLSWFTPGEIHGELSAAGLTVVEDLPASALLNRYLDEKASDTGSVLTARATA
jgi:O-methyltransferase involved in polyketide biosynthesis